MPDKSFNKMYLPIESNLNLKLIFNFKIKNRKIPNGHENRESYNKKNLSVK